MADQPLIDISPENWRIVRDILQRHVPDREVWAFGSRAKWTAKEFSDLDIAVIGDEPLSIGVMAELSESFQESALPFKVDVVDWAVITPSFRKIIEGGKVLLSSGGQGNESLRGWRKTTWGELATLEYGKSLRGYGSEGKYQVYRTNGPIGWHSQPFCEVPSVVIGRKGAYRGVHYSPAPFFVIDTAFFLKPKVDFDIKWAYYQLLTQDINGMDSGSAIPSTSRDEFYKLQVLVPPLSEQREMSAVLTAFDDKISLLREANVTLEAIAQALFKSWFVDFDPVRAKAEGREPEGVPPEIAELFPSEFEDSELGEIPQGWKTKPVYDLAEYINGAAYKAFSPNGEERGLPIIKIAELKAGITSQTAYSDVSMPEKYLLETGDILLSWSGNPDTSIGTFIWHHGRAWLNQHIFRVVIQQAAERPFVLQTLKHLRPVFAELARNKQTTGLGHFTVADMKRLLVVQPNSPVLVAFGEMVTPIHARIFENEQQAITLTSLRDSLLPKLMAGNITVGGDIVA